MLHSRQARASRLRHVVSVIVALALPAGWAVPAAGQFGAGGVGGGGAGGGIGAGGLGVGGGAGGLGVGGGAGGLGVGGGGGVAVGGQGGQGGGIGGVFVDAKGMLRVQAVADGGLDGERLRAAREALPGDLRVPARLRKVALSRLDAEYAAAVAAGRGVPDEILKLAGLTRVQYVFIYPAADGAAGEVVLAGPAEPWITDGAGRCVGLETGSPTLLLEDLAAALRAFAPGQPHDRIIGCSIDPTPNGLAAMQDFIRRTGRVNPQTPPAQIVAGMQQALGPQKVSVMGVSPATHLARVLVEADYRMKLIGIGLERPPVRMATWVDLAGAGAASANALRRWYFVPDYQRVRIAADGLSIELVGSGVKLCGTDEVVLPNGRRLGAEKSDKASKTFTEAFTRNYAEIAARSPVYAQLRNAIDLVVAAAWMQDRDAFGQSGWDAAALRDEARCPIETLPAAAEAETAINAVWRGNRLLTPIGGGVTVVPRMALDAENLLADEEGEVKAAQAAVKLPATGWYWD